MKVTHLARWRDRRFAVGISRPAVKVKKSISSEITDSVQQHYHLELA